MNSYGIEFKKLDEFDDIKYGKYHYNYKTVDFMLNWYENVNKTVIVFHARVDGSEKFPIFYKHNSKSDKFNILSLSDKLLEQARGCQNILFFGTKEIEYDKIYEEIIKNILKLVGTTTNIFFGSCSGAHPAIRYGLLFGEHIVVTNGYTCIDESTFEIYSNKVRKFANLNMICVDTKEISKIYAPKHLHIYVNKNDTFVFDLNKDFYLHCKKYFSDKISMILHDTVIKGQDPHAIFYPENQTFESIIESI